MGFNAECAECASEPFGFYDDDDGQIDCSFCGQRHDRSQHCERLKGILEESQLDWLARYDRAALPPVPLKDAASGKPRPDARVTGKIEGREAWWIIPRRGADFTEAGVPL